MKPCALMMAGLLASTPGLAGQTPALVAQLLDAVGGRDAWSRLRYVHTYAVNHHPQARLPYTQEGWIDLDQPRHLLELCSFDLQRQRAYTDQGGWGVSEGESYAFDAERHAEEIRFWHASIYRLLRLLAKAEPGTEIEVREDRIHLMDGGTYRGWIQVDPESGAPRSLGNERDAPAAVTFAGLQAFGPVAWVGSGEEPGGWNFEMLSFALLGPEVTIDFGPPADISTICRRH